MEKLGNRSYLRTLCGLAVPVMLEQLGQILLGTVDTYFAGQIGDNAIAAVNVTNLFINLIATSFASLGVGIMVMISRALGNGDEKAANRILRQAVLAGAAIGLGFGCAGTFLRRPLLTLAGARGEILSLGQSYFSIVCAPIVLMCLTIILANGLKAAQNTRSSMAAALAANAANVVLDALFIRLGLGVFGLGLATTLSRLLNLGILAVLYFRPITPLRLGRSGWRLELPLMRELLGYSGAVMLTYLCARLAILVHGALILRLGSTFYVANSITTQIDEYACIPSAGFEAATATMVSNSIGAGRPLDARRYTRLAFFSNAACMTGIGLILAVFAVPLAGLFTKTAAIWPMVRQILTFMVFFNWTSSLSHILTSAVQGTGDSKYPLWVTLAANILMRLSLGYFLAYQLHWDLMGIWIGIVLDFLMRGILLGRRLRRQFRKLESASVQE